MTILVGFIGSAMMMSSYFYARSALHPLFIMATILFVMFYSDFMIRGYADRAIAPIPIDRVPFYQFTIIGVTLIGLTLCVVLTKHRRKPNASLPLSKRALQIVTLVASAIFYLELQKRFASVHFSLSDFISYSFGPRFGRPWGQSGAFGGDNFVGSLIAIVFPLSAILFGIGLVFHRSLLLRVVSSIGWMIVVALLFGNGSRTFFAIALIFPAILHLITRNSGRARRRSALTLTVLVIVAAYSFSIMYQSRTFGYLRDEPSTTSFVYHQDNSYYMAIWAGYLSDSTGEHWMRQDFLLSSLLNFVPRAIWKGKPALDQEFYGSYKPFYVTSSFIGEAFALFGVLLGAGFAICVICLSFILLQRFYRKAQDPISLLVYLLMCFYVYMNFRSLLNISMGIYIPAAAIMLSWFLQKVGRSAQSLPARTFAASK